MNLQYINRAFFLLLLLLLTLFFAAHAQVTHPAFHQRKANSKEFATLRQAFVKHHPLPMSSGQLDSVFRSLEEQSWSPFGLYPFCFELNKQLYKNGIQGLQIQPAEGVHHSRKHLKIGITFIEDKPIVTESGEEKLPVGVYLLSLNRKPIKDWVDIAIHHKYGEIYPHGSFSELTDNFSSWIGELSPTDTFSILYMDFFEKKVHQLVLSGHRFEGFQQWMASRKSPAGLSSTALEETDPSELVYSRAIYGIDKSWEELCKQGAKTGVLDLRDTDTLLLQDAVGWSKVLTGNKVGFSISKKAATPDMLGSELKPKEACPVNITLLTNGRTGVAATLLASAIHDHQAQMLAGSETGGAYQGGFLPIFQWLTLFEGKVKIGIPLYYLKYEGDLYPLKDRGIIPEHLFQGTWEDYMQGEDAELSALIRQLTEGR